MGNCEKLFELNSPQQNEFLVWKCLEKTNLSDFLRLLKGGMPLTAFMLTSMVLLDYEKKDIKRVLIEAKCVDTDDVIKWMKIYFSIEELQDVLPKFDNCLPQDYPENAVCVEFGLWTTLCARKEYDLVAQNAPDPYKILSDENNVRADQALLKIDFDKYAPFVFAKGNYSAFLLSQQGWKYLIDHGVTEWLLHTAKYDKQGDLFSKSDIVSYCLEKGQADEVYKFVEYRSELLKQKAFEVFRENHSYNSEFLSNYPQEVDWEDLWKHCYSKSSRKHLKEKAYAHRDVQKCADFLWNHSCWINRMFLLASPVQP